MEATTAAANANENEIEVTVTEEVALTPVALNRRVYLRGPKGKPKRVLVLVDGELFEAGSTVSGYEELGGSDCTVLVDPETGIVTAQFGNGVNTTLTPAS